MRSMAVEHRILEKKRWPNQQQGSGGRVVFFLTDQAFQLALPVKEVNNCVATHTTAGVWIPEGTGGAIHESN